MERGKGVLIRKGHFTGEAEEEEEVSVENGYAEIVKPGSLFFPPY